MFTSRKSRPYSENRNVNSTALAAAKTIGRDSPSFVDTTPSTPMIKRYIPTSQGVMVIEVPKESLDTVVQRLNLMRVGKNINDIPRAGSLRSGGPGRTGSLRGSFGGNFNNFDSAATGSRTASLRNSSATGRGSFSGVSNGSNNLRTGSLRGGTRSGSTAAKSSTSSHGISGNSSKIASSSATGSGSLNRRSQQGLRPPQSENLDKRSQQSSGSLNRRSQQGLRSDSLTKANSSRADLLTSSDQHYSDNSLEQELSVIDEEIKKQKNLQHQLFLKKQEYLNLKSQNNKNLSELNQYESVVNTTINEDEEEKEILGSSAKDTYISKPVLQDPTFNQSGDFHDSNEYQSKEDEKTSHNLDYYQGLREDGVKDTYSNSIYSSDIEQDDKLDSHVDELHDVTIISDFHDDSFQNHNTVVDQQDDKPINFILHSGSTLVQSNPPFSTNSSNNSFKDSVGQNKFDIDDNFNKSNSEIGIINQYVEDDQESGFNDYNDKSQLAQSLRPKFSNIPLIIENTDDTYESQTNDTLTNSIRAPFLSTGSSVSSIRSAGSSESPSRKPLKSAMKNSHSNINLNPSKEKNGEKKNAAHDLYLSLATTENTKLNSKLSSNGLNDPYAAHGNQNFNSYQPQQSNPNRMSQSLRQPPQQKGGLSNKSLRPNSVHNDLAERKAMSNRTLRDSVYVAPIAPHPALKPGYQSPSKAKAQELYAKANARPKSQFNQLQRKSSYSKTNDEEPGQQSQQAQQPSHSNGGFGGFHQNQKQQLQQREQQNLNQAKPVRTLRNQTPPQSNQNHENQQGGSSGFKSRFADSDDEEEFTPSANFAAYQEQTQVSQPVAQTSNNHVATLRDESTAKPKEKKGKFGGKLRKLFGKSKQ